MDTRGPPGRNLNWVRKSTRGVAGRRIGSVTDDNVDVKETKMKKTRMLLVGMVSQSHAAISDILWGRDDGNARFFRQDGTDLNTSLQVPGATAIGVGNGSVGADVLPNGDVVWGRADATARFFVFDGTDLTTQVGEGITSIGVGAGGGRKSRTTCPGPGHGS